MDFIGGVVFFPFSFEKKLITYSCRFLFSSLFLVCRFHEFDAISSGRVRVIRV